MILATINMITRTNQDRWNVGVDFTNFQNVNMYVISDILQNLGYQEDELDTNGCDYDYWLSFYHNNENIFPPLQCTGTGSIRTCVLRGLEDDYNDYASLDKNKKYTEQIKHGMNLLKHYQEKIKEENLYQEMID